MGEGDGVADAVDRADVADWPAEVEMEDAVLVTEETYVPFRAMRRAPRTLLLVEAAPTEFFR